MTIDIKPLVITPRPYKNESLKGFILRTSEINGYHSPCLMLGTAGMTPNQMRSVIPPLEILAPLFNRSLDEMKKIGYWRPWKNRFEKHVRILSHRLPSYYVTIQSPKLCTQCIAESGFVEAYWDLKHAIACPTHNTYALKFCPECKYRLSWFRPALLTCSCGCDLSQYKGELVNNQAALGLLTILRSKFLGFSLDYELLKVRLGFPVEHLDALTLDELISIIGRLENRSTYGNKTSWTKAETFPDNITLEKAGLALSHWPKGLYQYLHSFKNERTPVQGFGLRKQFESFYGSLFKSDIPKTKVSFIKDAFIHFGIEEWKQGYVTSKLDGGSGQGAQVVGVYGMAKQLGVMPSTAKRMIEKNLIQGKSSESNGRIRYFFDLSHGVPFESASGLSFTVRKASAWLGIPVSVLKILRQQKRFEVLHIANPTAAYHEQDLISFRDKLLKYCPVNTVFYEDIYITLKQVMLMKVGSSKVKALFISGILNRGLIALGNAGDSVGGMFFNRTQVKEFMLESKRQYFGSITVAAAAKYLHCDQLVVKSLYQNGLLAGDQKPSGLYIIEESLKAFAKVYISCAAIASRTHTNSSKIVIFCQERQIELHWFSRKGKQNPQPFIARKTASHSLDFMNKAIFNI